MNALRAESLEPVHEAFGLSYASYYVLQRVLLQQMPVEWQRRFVACLDELDGTFELTGEYLVRRRGEHGRFVEDPLADYRHPDWAAIDAIRRQPGGAE